MKALALAAAAIYAEALAIEPLAAKAFSAFTSVTAAF